jgi:uncharacterized membrane protein
LIPENLLKSLDILNFLGGGLCHQRAERTFSIDSLYMPVCSRCTGIYLGIFLSLLVLILLERKIKGEFPSLKIVLISVGVFLLMGVDVVLSTFNLIQSNNIIRLVTGFLSGWFMVLLLFPLANNVMFRRLVKRNYLDNWKKFLVWFIAGVALTAVFTLTYEYFLIFWSVLSILGLIVFVTLILFILLFSLNRRLLGSIDSWKRYVMAAGTGIVSAAALLSLFSYLRRFLM